MKNILNATAKGEGNMGALKKNPYKGKYSGPCGLNYCQAAPATWYHHVFKKYYCAECADFFNSINMPYFFEMNGHKICEDKAKEIIQT